MSIIAGIVCLSAEKLPPKFYECLLKVFPRGAWKQNKYHSPTAIILQATQSIFRQTDWMEDQHAVIAIAGLALHKDAVDNPIDLFYRAYFDNKLASVLPFANGTFSALWYDKRQKTLVIASDSLGGRPMYYAEQDNCLIFSTSLSLLRSLPWFELTPDLSAFAEQEALGYPLGNRTCYHEVHLLLDNELLVVNSKQIQTSRYYDWTTLAQDTWGDVDAVARLAACAVKNAVIERVNWGSHHETALLSGGLDSRVIVSVLNTLGRPVQAINISRKDSQDDVLASRFAQHIGVSLEKAPWNPLLPGITTGNTTARMLTAATISVRGKAVFSGDGGGETLGILLFDPSTHDCLVEGNLRGAVLAHTHSYSPPKRMLHRDAIDLMMNSAQKALEADLLSRHLVHVSKAMQISLLCNDLRCHLHDYFDRISDTEVELLLPFYDRRVIESVLRLPLPLDRHLYHRFYMRVIEFLPADIRDIAWQSYPGRPPSPVPPDSGIPNQWSIINRYFGDDQCRNAIKRILNGNVAPPVRNLALGVAIIMHLLRIKNFASSFRFVNALSELYDPYNLERQHK